jgi:hypothetical protein
MWMDDVQYELMQDTKEKKVTARSARHTRTHCGKGGAVKFPSDYLTKKEIKAMSGECIQYASLKKPMSWEEFKALPKDLRKQYLEYIDKEFNMPPYTEVAKMFGVGGNSVSMYATDCGVKRGRGCAAKKWLRDKFYAWISGADLEAPVAPVVDEGTPVDDLSNEDAASLSLSDKETENTPVDTPTLPVICVNNPIPVIPKAGSMSFENNDVDDILQTLHSLLSGVRVDCTITWNCRFPNEDCTYDRDRATY